MRGIPLQTKSQTLKPFRPAGAGWGWESFWDSAPKSERSGDERWGVRYC